MVSFLMRELNITRHYGVGEVPGWLEIEAELAPPPPGGRTLTREISREIPFKGLIQPLKGVY